MRNGFRFKRRTSEEFGIFVEDPIDIPRAKIAHKEVRVPGNSRLLYMPEGENDDLPVIEPVTIPINCVLYDGYSIDDVGNWLRGYGDLEICSDGGRVRKAFVANQIDLAKVIRARADRRFTVQFRCEGFRYNAMPGFDVMYFAKDTGVSEITYEINNPGTAAAAPLLEVGLLYPGMSDENDNPVQNIANSITINGTTLEFISVIADITVYVDCEAKIAYTVYPGIGENGEDVRVLATNMVGGDWPVIPPGSSNITITGYIDRVAITPRWRWL